MNAITKALSEVGNSIPPEILGIGFMEKSNMINTSVSLEEMIMSKVLRPRVLVDTNLVGGIQTVISLDKCNISVLPTGETVVKVPKTATNNKSIMSVLSLIANTAQVPSTLGQGIGGSDLVSAGVNLMNNLSNAVSIGTSRLELIADNTILVQDPSLPLYSGFVRCVLENSTNLENISPRNYGAFSILVILAVKAYIYNNLIVKLDKGYIWGGHELGTIKEIVDSYSDANEMYLTQLNTVWKKVAFLNNSNATSRLVTSMISNTL